MKLFTKFLYKLYFFYSTVYLTNSLCEPKFIIQIKNNYRSGILSDWSERVSKWNANEYNLNMNVHNTDGVTNGVNDYLHYISYLQRKHQKNEEISKDPRVFKNYEKIEYYGCFQYMLNGEIRIPQYLFTIEKHMNLNEKNLIVQKSIMKDILKGPDCVMSMSEFLKLVVPFSIDPIVLSKTPRFFSYYLEYMFLIETLPNNKNGDGAFNSDDF